MSTIKSLRFDLSSEWDGAGVTQARDDIDRLRQDIDDLRNRMITIDVDDAQAVATLDEMRAKLDDLKDKSIRLMGEKADLQAKIDEAKAELDSIKDRTVAIKADAKEADADIAFTQARLDELHDKRIHIDVDSSTAAADMARLDSSIARSEANLERLNQQKMHIGQDAAQAAQDFDNANQRLGSLNQSMANMNREAGSLRGETSALATEFNRLAGTENAIHSIADGEKKAAAETRSLGTDVDSTSGKFRQMASDALKVGKAWAGGAGSLKTIKTSATDAGGALQRLTGEGTALGGVLSAAGSAGSAAMSGLASSSGMIIGVLAAIIALSPIVAASIGLIPLIFIGIAGAMISKNQELQASFQSAMSGVGTAIEQDAMPLVKALIGGLQELGDWIKTNGTLIGGAFQAAVPLVQPLINMITNFVASILPGLTVAMQNMAPLFAAFSQGWGYVGAAMGQAAAIFSRIGNLAGAMQNIFQALSGFLIQLAQSIASVASADHGQLLMTVFDELSKVMAALTPILVSLAPAFTALAQLIGNVLVLALKLAMPAIAALAPILTLAAKGLDFVIQKFTDFVTFLEANFIGRLKAAWSNIQQWANDVKQAFATAITAIQSAWSSFASAFSAAWSALWNGVKGVGQSIWSTLQQLWHNFTAGLQAAWAAFSGFFQGAWSALWNGIKAIGQTIWQTLQQLWSSFLTSMRTLWSGFQSFLQGAWSSFWNGIKGVGQALWASMQQLWSSFLTTMKSTWDTISGTIKTSWDTMWNAIKTTATTIWNDLKTGAADVWHTIANDFKTLVSDVRSIWNGIVSVFKTPVNLVIDAANAVLGFLGIGGGIPHVATGGYISGGNVQRHAAGGYISGPGGPREDRVPAMLSNGEFVMQAAAVDHYGVGHMHAMNQMKYAMGGPVHLAGGGTPGNPGGGPVQGSSSNAPNVIGSPAFKQAFKQDPGFNAIKAAGGLAAQAIMGPLKAAIDGIINAIPHPMPPLGSPWGDIPWGGARKVADSVLSWVASKVQSILAAIGGGGGKGGSGGGPGAQSAPSGNLQQWLQQAGIPQSQWGYYATLVAAESGGNPLAYNANGGASGLTQFKPATFAAYGSGSIWNPVDALRATQNYTNAVYGGIQNIPGLGTGSYKGYALGTSNALAGWAMVGERGPEMVNFGGGERVDPFNKLIDAVNSVGESKSASGDVHINMPVTVTAGGNPGDVTAEFINIVFPQLEMAIRSGTGRRR